MKVLITNIKELVQVRNKGENLVAGNAMKALPTIKNAYLLIDNDRIANYGIMNECSNITYDQIIDVSGKLVLPTWCDSHSHIVYAGNREQEFVDRINGLSYEEIANRGGGILNSAKMLELTDEDELFNQSIKRVKEVIKMGTGILEIKSGYGLSLESELKMLRVIKRIKTAVPIMIKATFLGAHALPFNFKNKRTAYIDHIINDMLPLIHRENLADFIDVFCEKGYFNLEDTARLLIAGKEYGLLPKIHVNQFNAFGGVALAVKHGALSVDHLEELNAADINALKGSKTIPVALPSCSFFLGIPYTPARSLMDAGLPLALATDYNPGSTPSGNMNFVVSTACIKMKMTPEEAINAATINGAYAMGCAQDYGSISIGKKANLIITKNIPSYNYLPYAFGENHIEQVLINGRIFN
ncbi:imidazolonepropionase [Aestuariivivens sediminis]|uniref:imidazolonepropionase n=1 Tax=Aestuariivivens sediminis TaxID=2913557 RepID=UPI001F5AEA7C|nr:imidazolonepropionase [Aestuariivivens sediminis]